MFSSLSSIARQAEACQPESSWLEISSPSSASDKKLKKPIQHRPSRPPTKLVTYHELPDWYQDNPHIHSGYRPVNNSSSACINSLKYVHNETVNIYSHLIPGLTAVLAALFLHAYFDSRFPDADVADKLVFGVFLAAAATCLGISAAFHTFISHSEEICHRWLLCDFVGIIALNMGDALSGIYMVFYCEPVERDLYWATVCLYFSESAVSCY